MFDKYWNNNWSLTYDHKNHCHVLNTYCIPSSVIITCDYCICFSWHFQEAKGPLSKLPWQIQTQRAQRIGWQSFTAQQKSNDSHWRQYDFQSGERFCNVTL
jgi:hypothetical protein